MNVRRDHGAFHGLFFCTDRRLLAIVDAPGRQCRSLHQANSVTISRRSAICARRATVELLWLDGRARPFGHEKFRRAHEGMPIQPPYPNEEELNRMQDMMDHREYARDGQFYEVLVDSKAIAKIGGK